MTRRGQLGVGGVALIVVGLALPAGAPDEAAPYARRLYLERWPDDDRDCQDARAELLIARSLDPVAFASPRGCRVIAGRWIDAYTGAELRDAEVIDVDHIVPLAEAHRSGAASWPASLRERFAVYPENLAITHRSINRAKRDRDPADWWPPTGGCDYATQWLSLKQLFNLTLDAREAWALVAAMRACDA